ncbi:uncharacterized protein LOC111623913 [Centruroides sculpturatus]|uniref:uncharacterized protein LOC111623913 n=1 Tax=Centruroides sculpturatus TaxID=218467 RepID=UPI000C6D2CAC|nr:uncharacterized protein LOC111623913 [Centruroides sculpturatus]
MKTSIIIKILLLVMAETKDVTRGRRSTTKFPKMELLETFSLTHSPVPRYNPLEMSPLEGNGFFSTLRLLGKFGSQLFDKALDRINSWTMESISKPVYTSLGSLQPEKPSGLSKIIFASEDLDDFALPSTHVIKYEPLNEPTYLELSKDWWDPPCKYCYENFDLLEQLPPYRNRPIVKINYDQIAHSSPPRIRENIKLNRKPIRYQIKKRKPLRKFPKWKISKNRNVWNPITSSEKDFIPRQRPRDYVKASSSLILKKYPSAFPVVKYQNSFPAVNIPTSRFPLIKNPLSSTFSIGEKYRSNVSPAVPKYPDGALKVLSPPKTTLRPTTTTIPALSPPTTVTVSTSTEPKTSYVWKRRKSTTLRPFRKPQYYWKSTRTTPKITTESILETSTQISYSVIRQEVPNNDTSAI